MAIIANRVPSRQATSDILSGKLTRYTSIRCTCGDMGRDVRRHGARRSLTWGVACSYAGRGGFPPGCCIREYGMPPACSRVATCPRPCLPPCPYGRLSLPTRHVGFGNAVPSRSHRLAAVSLRAGRGAAAGQGVPGRGHGRRGQARQIASVHACSRGDDSSPAGRRAASCIATMNASGMTARRRCS
jgi:hypothetical protein